MESKNSLFVFVPSILSWSHSIASFNADDRPFRFFRFGDVEYSRNAFHGRNTFHAMPRVAQSMHQMPFSESQSAKPGYEGS